MKSNDGGSTTVAGFLHKVEKMQQPGVRPMRRHQVEGIVEAGGSLVGEGTHGRSEHPVDLVGVAPVAALLCHSPAHILPHGGIPYIPCEALLGRKRERQLHLLLPPRGHGEDAQAEDIRFHVLQERRILQSPDDPCRFILYEAYATAADAAAHKDTAHYLAWRERVADWMAEPRQGMPYNGLYPAA